MAGYIANYLSDFGKTYRRVRLSSRLITVDGLTSRTKPPFDLPFLPQIYQDSVVESSLTKGYCSLNIKARAVKLYRNDGDYLYLEHPFMPTSVDYLTFVAQLNSNPLIMAVEHVGEELSDLYTDLLTQNA